MSLIYIGVTYPSSHKGNVEYEIAAIEAASSQINQKFAEHNNLLINATWFGPQFSDNNNTWQQYLELVNSGIKIDNLFLLSTVDPLMLNNDQTDAIIHSLGNPKVFKIGNFDSEYDYNYTSVACADHFKPYPEDQLLLTNLKYLFINYNRKPRAHRVKFVRKLKDKNLLAYGIVTLGKPNIIYDQDPNNDLYLSIGEKAEDYVQHGNWFINDEFGIPHDLFSLHNMDYWSHHFLNIISETEFNPWDDIFVTEKTWKPILGLRPFVINEQTKIYKYLRDHGFHTFNHYFNGIELENIPEYAVHDSIINVLQHLIRLDTKEILSMYNDMLPSLRHNQQRLKEFAREQQFKMEHIFD